MGSLTGKPDLASTAPVTNDGFWPDLSHGDLLGRYRVPSDYADDIIPTALLLAMVRVNEKLEAVKDAIVLLGYITLQLYLDNNPQPVGDKHELTIRYEHAVYSRAKAGLIPINVNAVSRPADKDAPKSDQELTEQHWLDESQSMIAAFHKQFISDVDPDVDAIPANGNVHVALM